MTDLVQERTTDPGGAASRPTGLAVPVLLYHSISDDPPEWIAPFTVTPAVFAAHLNLIVASGRRAMTVTAFADAIRRGAGFDEPPVVITFDDGYADFATAAVPALVARRLPSTLYVVTGALRGNGTTGTRMPPAEWLRWEQLAELEAAGVEIGAHSETHLQLDTVAPRRAAAEVVGCRARLEDELQHPVPSFAYPHGYSSRAVRRIVERAGFTSACAVRDALSSPGDDVYNLARLMLRADTPLEAVRSWLAGEGARVAPYPEQLRTTAWRWVRRARALRPGDTVS